MKLAYSKLKLKNNTKIKTISFNNNDIEILQYLPIADKYSLINITLQQSKEGIIYHSVKKDMFFHLNLVFMYTNLSFTDKQKEDIEGLYDTWVDSGLMEESIKNIPEDEYNTLYTYFNEQEENLLKYDNTLLGTLKNWINEMPKNMEEMQNIVKNFKPEDFQSVIDFAKSANGNREID